MSEPVSLRVDYHEWLITMQWQTHIIIKAGEVLCSATKTVLNHALSTDNSQEPLNVKPHSERERGKIIIHRHDIETVLQVPKDLRSQIVLELAGLQGFRTGEVSSFRVEYCNFESGMLKVLDSKKDCLTEMPMRRLMAKHLFKYIQYEELTSGILLQPLPNAHHVGRKQGSKTLGEGLSESQLNRICFFWCDFCNKPRMTLRKYRQYFFYWCHYIKHMDLFDTMLWGRHDNPGNTQLYVEALRDFDEAVERFRVADESDLVRVERVEAWQKLHQK